MPGRSCSRRSSNPTARPPADDRPPARDLPRCGGRRATRARARPTPLLRAHSHRAAGGTSMIESPLLTDLGGYVGGRWITRGSSGHTIAVTNPATGEKLADVPDMGAAETTAAIESAAAAMEKH